MFFLQNGIVIAIPAGIKLSDIDNQDPGIISGAVVGSSVDDLLEKLPAKKQ